MSCPTDLDEQAEDKLRSELARRYAAQSAGLCDYCNRLPDTSSCKFPERHKAATVKRNMTDPTVDFPDGNVEVFFESGDMANVNVLVDVATGEWATVLHTTSSEAIDTAEDIRRAMRLILNEHLTTRTGRCSHGLVKTACPECS